MKNFWFKFLAFFPIFASPVFSDTIHIEPGQCIMVGAQQICAASRDEYSGRVIKNHPPKIVSKASCRFGAAYENDKTIKGYGLYVLRMNKKDNSKNETLIKTFSPAEKAECEAAAVSYLDE